MGTHTSAPLIFGCCRRFSRAPSLSCAPYIAACCPLTSRSLYQDPPRKDKAEDDDDDDEEAAVTAGVAAMAVGGAAAPFTFNPAPKGQSPFKTDGAAAPMFSFPVGGAGGAPAEPNFSFNFAQKKKDEEGEEGDDDDEDDEDPVEEFIKSLPEPVQQCVSALDTLDAEVCELESQFRKEMRELERKVCLRSTLF